MSKEYKFEGEIVEYGKRGFYIDFPFDGKKEFGTRGPVRVKAWYDGHLFLMSLLPKGGGIHWLHIRKEIRKKIAKADGEKVAVVIEQDLNPPEIKVPEYIMWLLEEEPDMLARYNNLSYSMKKNLIDYVTQPKSEEAKVKRVNRFFEILREQKSPN